jgi:hypothetical protein
MCVILTAIADVSDYSNGGMKTVIHNYIYVILLLHVSALVENHYQSCKADNLYTTHKNGTS